MRDLTSNTLLNPKLLFNFFLYFARFEYALKASGYIRSGQRTKDGLEIAFPDWENFANRIKNNFNSNDSQDLKKAVDYVWENPPMTEVITEDDKILFVPPVYNYSDFDFVIFIKFIRNIRNNLFHGGKHGDIALPQDTERNEELLKSALLILDACLFLEERVRTEFDNAVI